ncbi:MAG: FHA domain-containing protein [Gemmatimonadaceae bacterium]
MARTVVTNPVHGRQRDAMSFLVIDSERYALPIGETRLGGSGDDTVPCPALLGVSTVAIFTVMPEHATTVRRGGSSFDASVTVNDEPLGTEPREIHHGWRIGAAGRTILYGDVRSIGSTAHVTGVTDEDLLLLAQFAPAEPTADSGGCLIALRDGSVIRIPDGGLTIGRDPECGIALASKDVSRRHAIVAPGLQGYTVTDTSSNGVFVNGARIDETKLLGRGDVIRTGAEEFRFEAAAASYEPAPELRAAPLAIGRMRTGAASREGDATPSVPAMRPARARSRDDNLVLLATLEILNGGVLRGRRIRIERPVAQIGRAEHNDVLLSDNSISGSHATLFLRGKSWHVLDLGSTNGTYVNGERVSAEQIIRGGSELRVGNIKMLFRTIGTAPSGPGETRDIVGMSDDHAR